MDISFYVVSLRWRPPKLIINDEEAMIASLAAFLPITLAKARIQHIERLVKNHCPSYHIDFYIFVIAVICIICSAIFTFVARSLNISMWCPLLLLLIPTGLSFWTSKRRSSLMIKIKEFESRLKKTLYEFNTDDTSHHIIWSVERIPIEHAPTRSTRFCLKIYITKLDNEMGGIFDINGEELPTYQQASAIAPTLLIPLAPPSYELSLIRQPEPAVTLH